MHGWAAGLPGTRFFAVGRDASTASCPVSCHFRPGTVPLGNNAPLRGKPLRQWERVGSDLGGTGPAAYLRGPPVGSILCCCVDSAPARSGMPGMTHCGRCILRVSPAPEAGATSILPGAAELLAMPAKGASLNMYGFMIVLWLCSYSASSVTMRSMTVSIPDATTE